MGQVLGRATVLAGSVCLLFCTYGINTETTVLALTAINVGLFGGLPRGERDRREPNREFFSSRLYAAACGLLYGAFFLLCVFLPPALAMAPFVVYDAVRNRRRTLYLWLFAVVWSLLAGNVMFGVYAVILAFFAAELSLADAGYERLAKERIRQRDAAVEQELCQEQRTRELIERQDANIYLATLQERNRIAREIHDNVGHMLTRSILQLGAIKVINQSDVLREPLERLHETLDAAMTSMRNSVHDLHDGAVDLRAAVGKLAAELEGFEVQLDYDMGRELPGEIKYAFLAITKEALNNAVKYSDGDCVTIVLREHPGFYQLMIGDNGHTARGAKGESADGIGLQNMRDRVAALGGTIKFSQEGGFRVLVSVMKEVQGRWG